MADTTPPFYVGARMPDGTVYAGISPDTNQPMFTTPSDAPMVMTFDEAVEYAKNLKIGDKKDFRLPSTAELKVMFNENAAIGGFNPVRWNDSGKNWSGTPDGSRENRAGGLRLRDGRAFCDLRTCYWDIRCIRTDPPEEQKAAEPKRPPAFNL